MKGIKIAVIGGGSSYTPELIEGFIKRSDKLPLAEIWLVDIEEGREKLNTITSLAKRMFARVGMEVKVVACLDRKAALQAADYVITQFRVGGLAARALDEEIPLRHGVIGQETTGPGGFAKALRTIPVILDICRDMSKYAPNAWLINFTNPAGIITEAVYRHTGIKTLGLCNVPIGMVNNIARLLGVASARIDIDFIGLNHLVWGRDVYLDGEKITEKVIELLSDGKSTEGIADLEMDPEIFKSLAMIPCPYYRYYYMAPELLATAEKDFKAGRGVRATQVMAIEEELFSMYADANLSVKPKQLEKRGGAFYSDAAVSLIGSIHNNDKKIHAVNVRNNGAISNLPSDVVIETNAVIGSFGAKPLVVGKLDDKINGLVQTVKSYELLTVEAAVTGNYHIALAALISNPLVDAMDSAKKILADILKENKKYLPQF